MDNPILDYSDTVVYERGRLPQVTSGEDVVKAADAVVGAYQGFEMGKFAEDLEAADAAALRDVEAAEAEIEDVVGAATANEDPEFAEAVRQISRFQLMKDQGVGDATSIAIRREHALRTWTARHPEWAGDLIRAANEHAGGSTLGESIAKTRGASNPIDEIETHARTLGVDMALRYSDPVAFAGAYLKAQKQEGRLKEAARTLQLVQTEQNTLKTLAEGSIQQVFDTAVGELVGKQVDTFAHDILTMAESPSIANEAEHMFNIQQQARALRAQSIAFVTRQSNGLISVADAPSRVAQIQQLDAIINASDPAELNAVAAGIRAVRETEVEGWYRRNPGLGVEVERLKIFGSMASMMPGLPNVEAIKTETARITGYFLGIENDLLNNKGTGVNIPRTDSLGATQDPTAASRSTYNATSIVAQTAAQQPAVADRHMLNLADSYAAGERPSKATLGLARNFMATDTYRDVVATSPLSRDNREDRAAKITDMLVSELAEDTPQDGGQPLMWTRAFGGVQWTSNGAVLLDGGRGVNLDAANAEIGPYLTQMVQAIAHASGLTYEAAAARLWPALQARM